MRLLSPVKIMSYIVTQLFAIVSVALLAAALLSSPVSAETDAVAADACVSAAMVRQLRREGNSVRVSPWTELVSEKAGSGENEKGIAYAQAQDTLAALEQAHHWFEKGARKGYAPAQ